MKYSISSAFGEFFQELIGFVLLGCFMVGIIGVMGNLIPPHLSNGSHADQFFRSVPGVLFSTSLLLISVNGSFYFMRKDEPWHKNIGSGIVWANFFILLFFVVLLFATNPDFFACCNIVRR